MKKFLIISAITACIFTYSAAYTEIVVKSVDGDVSFKEESQWKPLTTGQILQEGTKISTGIRSSAVISIDNSTLKIRQLTMMKIFRNRSSKNDTSTHVGLKYGSLNARVKRIGTLKTSFKITTPVATSSVRGTEENVSYGPKSGMLIEVLEGTVAGENSDGVSEFISGRSIFRMGPGDSRPKDLLADIRDKALNPIFDKNMTEGEKDNNDFSDGVVGNNEHINFVNTVLNESTTSGGQGNSNVNIDVVWPEK